MDILGFSELVKSIPVNPERFHQILAALTDLKAQTQTKRHDDGQACFHNREMTVFSDGIVISYRVDEPNAAYYLCGDLVWLSRRLLEMGLLCRGAVAVGSLYHKGGIVFGDAFLQAYELERSVAIYPRIVLQDAVLREANRWWKDMPAFNSRFPNDDQPRSSERDSDGNWFLNPLSFGFWTVDPLNPHSVFLKKVREEIFSLHADANREGRASVLAKLAWLANKFNEALDGARSYHARCKAGRITQNGKPLQLAEGFDSVDRIDCDDWTVIPLSKSSEAARNFFPLQEDDSPKGVT